MKQLTLTALPDFPLVQPGDDLSALILRGMAAAALQFEHGDVLVLAQKIVSKTENRYRYLDDVTPGEQACALAAEIDKDPRILELILSESRDIVRKRKGLLIVEHRNGYVHANAGIDQSNIECDPDHPRVLLLPENPDASARALREAIYRHTGKTVAIIINDSAGRAWRNGIVGMAIGTAGLQPVVSHIGQRDLFQRKLEVTEVAVADELAAAASILMGQAAEGSPVVLIRGAQFNASTEGSAALIRDKSQDLFR